MKKNKFREKYNSILSLAEDKGKTFEVNNKNIGDKVVIIKKEKEETETEDKKTGLFGKLK